MSTRLRLASRFTALPLVGALVLAGCSGNEDGGDTPPDAPAYATTGVSARVLPQLAHAGEETASPDDAAWVVEATLEGAEKGTEVELLAAEDGEWVVADTRETDGKGRVSLTSPTGGELHVVADLEGEAVGAEVTTDDVPGVSFEDAFDEDSVHGDGPWQTRAQGHVGVRQCSEAVDEAAEVVDGVLRLSVMDDETRGACDAVKHDQDYLVNGHVGTETSYSFTYGYAAARVKFQSERGQHGAFWLQAMDGQLPRGPVKGGTEIDVVEYFGDDHPSGGLTSFVYWWDKGKAKRMKGGWVEDPEQYGDGWSEKYHVFSVEWTPEEYVFRIDGQVTHRLSGPTSDRKNFLILSLLSSDYELKHFTDELPVHMDVDWVRTWETGDRTG